jgi:hypothetical protein
MFQIADYIVLIADGAPPAGLIEAAFPFAIPTTAVCIAASGSEKATVLSEISGFRF